MPNEDPTQPGTPPPELHGLDPGELLARGLHTVKPSAGTGPWLPPTPEELAALLPQYRIESLLGHGGMGAVYKGTQAALDRPVAIKLLPAELAADADFIARFQREARTLAKLQHSSIVAVYDFGQTSAGHLYFVMEYVDGTDLQRILKGPGLKPEQAFMLIGQICEALHYAHQQGVIHRDIKPANILITQDGRAKVADFGLARPAQDEAGGLTQTHMVMGTPDYMAPEQRSGDGHPDHRADIFALGVMLYEMLTGQRPHGAFQPPSHRVQVDVRIDEVVLKALQQEPDRRYQQASEMKVDVDRIRTTPPTPVKPKRSKALLAAMIVLGGIFVLLAFPFALRMISQKQVAGTRTNFPSARPAGLEARPPSAAMNPTPGNAALSWLPVEQRGSGWDKGSISVKDGWVEIGSPETGGGWAKQGQTFGNLAIRTKYQWSPPNNVGGSLSLNCRASATGFNATFTLWPKTTGLFFRSYSQADAPPDRWQSFAAQLIEKHEGTFELATIGNRVLARLDGQLIYDVEEPGLAAKGFFRRAQCWHSRPRL